MNEVRGSLIGFACCCVALGACAGPEEDARAQHQVPSFDFFPPVSDALHSHCGTLDCHGQEGRNLRLYGLNGLRLSQPDVPGIGATTDAEYGENYRSVTLFEPELLEQLLLSGGVNPERLTLVRKGRGTEHHKGKVAMEPGGPADRCLLAWLAGGSDEVSCLEAAERLPPDYGSDEELPGDPGATPPGP